MDGKNHLGIYISSQDATVVCVEPQGAKIAACFGVSTRGAEEGAASGATALVNLAAQGCRQRNLEYSDVFVALDCEMFLQHTVGSEFTDLKQISSTVRFDTEEAIAADIAEVAIAFRVTAQNEQGSKLAVFTGKQKVLSEIIAALQSNHMDPVSMEPDVSCLSRFVLQGEAPQGGTLVAMLSRKNGYFLMPRLTEQRDASAVRTLLIGHSRNRGDVLAREIPMTSAMFASVEMVTNVKVFDSLDAGAADRLAGRLRVATGAYEPPANAAEFLREQGEGIDSVETAIACGAALYQAERDQTVNFRNDFMPYQGGRVLLEKTVQRLGIAATALVIVLGVFTTMLLFQANSPAKKLRKKFAEDYTKVMMVKTVPSSFTVARKNLESTERQIKNIKAGLDGPGQQALPAKLAVVLDALNKCARQTDLKITKISLNERSITLQGDTSSRSKTLAVFQAIKGNNLEMGPFNYKTEDNGRDVFTAEIVGVASM